MTRILLLGASGFIGGHVRAGLADRAGVEVVTAGRRSASVDRRLDLATAGVAAVSGLLRTVAPDVVVNCAGATGTDPADLVAGNVVAVATLLEALGRVDPATRLVHLGSAAEYGPTPRGVAVAEHTPTNPGTPYGVTKLAGTALVLAAARQRRPVTVLRVFNPIGPGVPANLLAGRLVAELGRSAGEPGEVTVGPLDGHRDFIDVRDVAAAVVAAVTVPTPPPALLNIGSGRATAVRDLVGALTAVAGAPPVRETGAGSPRSAEVSWQCADIRAAQVALDWTPTIDLARSVADLWRSAALPAPA